MNSIEPPALGPEDRRRLVVSLLRDAVADTDVSGLAAALQRLCRAVTGALVLRGAAVHLMAQHAETGVAASSDLESRGVAELQFTSNEGPAVVAFRTRRPVMVPDLLLARGRWPGFCSLALERGVTGVFAFPLHEGAVSFGVLELYADGRGPLDGPDIATAATFARAATDLLLDGDTITPAGDLDAGLSTALVDRSRIHQAQGMVMVDLGITLTEALARMRARAFSSGTSLLEVADEVIAGTVSADMWLSDDTAPDGSSP
ncbi:MAG TPA: GAF and ANTAR domain-containing protein [Nocardioides sp.]|nr:GAF and ANTAR domain-containing protein [Nocardioides sp.]